jgi:hypothetical protein
METERTNSVGTRNPEAETFNVDKNTGVRKELQEVN